MLFRLPFILIVLTLLLTACGRDATSDTSGPGNRPNIVYILADDLGYGDLSVYGQTKFTTPNIDRLAREGLLFTNHYAGAPVCAPSRSTLLTGLHTGHSPVRGNREVFPEGQFPFPDSVRTLPEMMQEAGYVTGAFGKWGLGFPGSEGDAVNQGFDEFFGYNCQRLAHHYYIDYLRDGTDSIPLPGNAGAGRGTYAPDVIHDRALAFLDAHQHEPFFLYYPSLIPHAELVAPEAYLKRFREQFAPDEAYAGLDAYDPERGRFNFKRGGYGSQPETHAAFAAMVAVLDDQVGELLDRLDSLGLTDNTLVIFTSDNGPHTEGGADPDFFDGNGPLRGYKRDLYEGGIRVPLLVRWPGVVAPNTTTDHVSAFWDVFPTVADALSQAVPEKLDGISFLPTLRGRPGQAQHDYLYWEFPERGGRQALRRGDWKLVRYGINKQPAGAFELYNLRTDLGEENNLAATHPERVAELRALLDEARVESAAFPLFR